MPGYFLGTSYRLGWQLHCHPYFTGIARGDSTTVTPTIEPCHFFKGSRWIGGALCSILLLFLCGCGNSANVSGKISYQGRPITYGSVIFLRSDNSAFTAAIKPDGSYLVEGIPPGNASIAVISRNPALGRSAVHPPKPNSAGKPEAALQETAVQGWFPLPHNYEDAKSSGLTCDITKGQVIHDIELR